MPFEVAFQNFNSWPQSVIIPDATPTNDGVMTKAQAKKLAGASSGPPIFEIEIDNTDGADIDVTFPGGFTFTGNYSVDLDGYFHGDDAPMILTVVPRLGDPPPPAAKAPDGFRINLQAPVTQPATIRVWAHQ